MPPEQVTYENPVLKQKTPNFKLWAILLVVAIILLSVLNWLSNQAYLDIQVQGQAAGTVSYKLVNQANQKSIEFSADADSIKRRVPRGNYELTVRRGDSNAFLIARVGGFYSTTEVTAKTEAERGREFVGHSPKSCTHWLGDSPVSYECGGSFGSLVTHVPATAQLPTYTRPNPNPTEDVIEGLVSTKEGDVLLTYEAAVASHKEFEDEDDTHSPHVAFLLKDGLKLQQRTQLTDIPETDRVSVQPFRDGFLTYNKQFQSMRYYSNLKSKPQDITAPKPKNTDLSPYSIAVGNDLLAVAYNKVGSSEDADQDSVVTVQDNDQTREYGFGRSFKVIKICGTDKLCGVSDNVLYVYDVSDGGAEQLLTMRNVSSIENYKGGFVVVRSDGVMKFDVEKQEGVLQYSFGETYEFCGIQPTEDTYTVCTKFDPEGRNQLSMLYIEQNQTNDDDIDKKIAELWKSEQVGGLTIYGKYIHLTTNTGTTPYYQSGPGDIGYYPEAVRRANSKIRQELSRVGIDQKKYVVKITSL